jgi:hypothetical protein
MFGRLVHDLKSKVAAVQARERELTTPSDLTAFIGAGPDVAKQWQAARISARRKAAAIVLNDPTTCYLTHHRRTSRRDH